MGDLVRRIISIVLVSALVVAIVLGFFWLRQKFSSRIDPGEAIPGDFILCLETTNYNRLSSALQNHSNIWKEFREYDYIRNLDDHIHTIDSLKRAYAGLDNLFRGKAYIGVYPSSDSLSVLFALSSPERNATDQLLKLVSNETDISKEKYDSYTIYNIRFKESKPEKISFFESRGIFLLSPSREMLKRAILHLNTGKNAFQTQNYDKLISTLGTDVEAHVFVNFELLKILASKFLKPELIPDLSGFSNRAALDLEIKPNQVILNGFSAVIDSLDQQLSLFEGQEAVPLDFFSKIPSTAAYFKWIGLSDYPAYISQLQKSFPASGPLAEFREGFFEHFEGQVVEFVLRESNMSYPRYALMTVKSAGQAEDFFNSHLRAYAGGGELQQQEIRINENLRINASRLPLTALENILFGNLLGEAGYKWYCFYDNNLILGNSVNELRQFIYLNSLGRTLENDDHFKDLKNSFSSRSNFFIFFDPGRYLPGIEKLLQSSAGEVVNMHPESWKKLNAVAFQSTVAGNIHYFRLFANYSGQLPEQVNTVWERKLDANLAMKPAVVINHNSREKEIFVQDALNNIYLINNTGAIIWKQKADGKILSEVYQLDYYRNGKLQYLFNTENRLWLIDRNGNPVEKFPIELRKKATAGISLFDYDNNGDYRIPVPTEDNDILMYDKEGSIVSGWRFPGADHIIRFPLMHCRIGNRDYLVARDDFSLYITDRQGRVRVKPSKQIDFSENNPVFFQAGGAGRGPRLVASDREGEIHAFYFDGKVEKILSSDAGKNHFFLPADINGDSREEFIFTDSMNLKVLSPDAKLLFSEIYPEVINYPPVVYSFSAADKKIGVVASGSERIYLLNNDGSLYRGFPLKGSSLFSISSFPGLKDRFNLLVGNNDNFLYNYSVK